MPEHRIATTEQGFVAAGSLGIGTSVVTRAGPVLFVVAVTAQKQASGYTVYNFTVEDDHTYFVGTANNGIWTHNTYTFFRGTAGYEALEAVQEQAIDANRVAAHQLGIDPELGKGLYMTDSSETAGLYASFYNNGVGGGPAILKMEVPDAAWNDLVENHGAIYNVPTEGLPGNQSFVPQAAIGQFNKATTFSEVP